MKLPKKLWILILFGCSLGHSNAQAQMLVVSDFLKHLDPESRALVLEEANHAGVNIDELNQASVTIDESRAVVFNQESAEPVQSRRRSFLVFLGAGIGLVDTMGVTGTLVRRNAEGRLTWFAEGDIEYLQTRFGYAPDDIRVGFGYYPFERPWLSVALKLTHSSYSEKLGIGPQLSFQYGIGKKRNVVLSLRLGSTAYMGETNAQGGNTSWVSDIKFGVSVKLFDGIKKK